MAIRPNCIRAFFVGYFLTFAFILSAQNVQDESAAQRVTNAYIALHAFTGNEKFALKKAVRALEDKGLYTKLLSLNIGKFFADKKCYNLLAPSRFDGAFTLTPQAGNPKQTEGGISLTNGDQLNTHFINDLAEEAPELGIFWYTDTAIQGGFISSNSPFNIIPREENGKAYVSIWASSDGIPVSKGNGGFSLAQRSNADTVELYQGSTRYAEHLPMTTSNPRGGESFIQGNGGGDFILKIFGITAALTHQEVLDLKEIIDELVKDMAL